MKIITLKDDLEAVVGFGPNKASRLEAQGLFPRRRQLGAGQVGWLTEELLAWARALPPSDGRMRGEETRLRRKREREAA